MLFNQSVVHKFMAIALALWLSACAHHEKPKPQTMTVCDANGCAERPKNYASFEPANTVPVEDPQIVALEKLAANDPRAAFDLALRFFRGDGVRQDSYRSIKWMREAAEQGHYDAQKAMGRLYLTGLGEMGADYGEAQKWLAITVSRGDKEGAKLLAEATAARKSEVAEQRWYQRWQPIFYNYWYSGYRYNWYWRANNWYLY